MSPVLHVLDVDNHVAVSMKMLNAQVGSALYVVLQVFREMTIWKEERLDLGRGRRGEGGVSARPRQRIQEREEAQQKRKQARRGADDDGPWTGI